MRSTAPRSNSAALWVSLSVIAQILTVAVAVTRPDVESLSLTAYQGIAGTAAAACALGAGSVAVMTSLSADDVPLWPVWAAFGACAVGNDDTESADGSEKDHGRALTETACAQCAKMKHWPGETTVVSLGDSLSSSGKATRRGFSSCRVSTLNGFLSSVKP